jgi:hypothetical protein
MDDCQPTTFTNLKKETLSEKCTKCHEKSHSFLALSIEKLNISETFSQMLQNFQASKMLINNYTKDHIVA